MLSNKSKIRYKNIKSFLSISIFILLFSSTVNANSKVDNAPKISLNLINTPLETIFSYIESQSDFNFFYQNNTVDLKRLVTINVKNETIENILLIIFKKKNVIYKIIKKKILIKKNSQTIFGIIKDGTTGKTIPFCSISIANSVTGSSSNELGEFEIKVNSLPAKLVFSHINYKNKIVTITKNEQLIIKLKPLIYKLEEVIISSKKDFYAYEVAKKAFRRADVYAKNKKYGKAYYRQKSKNGNDYSEYSEIIYDVKYSTEGIDDWDIIEGRYALKGGTVNNKNYSLLSKILKSFQPNSEDLIFPLRDQIERYYKVRIIKKTNTKQGQIAVLIFTPYKRIKSPILEAEAYINTTNNQLLKLSATVKNDQFNIIRFKDKNATKKNYTLTYEMAFKKDSILDLVLDYMKVDQKFDYYKNDNLITHVTSSSTLSFFEHYTPNSRKKLGRQFNRNESDWQKINAIGYNQKFWKDNPIVKRTPIEKEIIDAFEHGNTFESIFINSRQQVSLTQSNISNDPFIKDLEKNVLNYNSYNPVEKVYLQTDKDLFTNKEDIWLSAYVTLGTKLHYSLASKVLYLNLINPKGKIVVSKTIPLNQGRGNGNITIPQSLQQGKYQLRAYTNWMRNFDAEFFFTKVIDIVNKENNINPVSSIQPKIDLQFFPEGGSAIESLNGRIAFKAIGIDGLGKEVSGKIVDSNNRHVLNFKTKDQGAGVFNLKPKKGETYSAILNNGLAFALPETLTSGYTMLVNNIKENFINIEIQASKNLRSKKFYVIGHMHNERYYQGRFEFGGKLLVDFEIPKNKLPSGVMTLTIFNEEGTPMAERVIFINSQNELDIKAKISKTLPNKDTEVEINVTDARGWATATDLSISVTDAGKYSKEKNKMNIISQLLLQSDIKGYIENPALFLNENNRSTKYKQELVMLTHGWRKINWLKIKNEKLDIPKKFLFQQGLTLSGIAKNKNKVLKNRMLKMVALSKNQYATNKTKTNFKGEFSFVNFNNVGNTKLSFNTTNSSGKMIEVDATLKPIKTNTIPYSNFKRLNLIPKTEEELNHAKLTALSIKNDSIKNKLLLNKNNNLLGEVVLKNVILREKKDITNFDRDNKDGYNMVPDHVIFPDQKVGETILDILKGFPNVKIQDGNVYIRMNKLPVLWVVDGLKLSGPPPKYDIANIEKIDVLKSTISTAVYGPSGVNGVIFIKTKTAKMSVNDILPSLNIIGHKNNKEFYVPKYNPNQKNYKDYRTTLYWNPMIRTDKDGKATLYFNKPKDVKNIQIVIEGLSKYGNPGVLIKILEEEE